MTDPRDFLAARLDEDEAAAHATLIDVDGSGDWRADERPVAWTVNLYRVRDANARPVVEEIRNLNEDDGSGTYVEYVNGAAVAAHIARHDPARVLREVAAKRAILTLIDPCPECLSGFRCVPHDSSAGTPSRRPATDEGERLLKLLAAAYSDHPDYRKEWAA